MQVIAIDHFDVYGNADICELKCVSLPYESSLHQGKPSNPAEIWTENLIIPHLHQKERMIGYSTVYEFQFIFGCLLCTCDKSYANLPANINK